MFEHLDDPAPPRLDDAFRARVERRAGQMRRRRRLATTSLVLVVAVGGAGLASAAYIERRDAAIDRVEVVTRPSTDGAVNVLVVGTDAREGQAQGRADTAAVVRLDDDGTVDVLSLPRDLLVSGTERRLGETYGDGPSAYIDALAVTTGVPVDHVIELTLDGFRDLVDDAGGLRLAVDAPVRDTATGLSLPASECAELDGDTALALVRSRRLEVFEEGRGWVTDPGGDFSRVKRTQTIVAAVLDDLSARGVDPGTLDRFSRVLADHARVDDGLSLGRLVDLARRLFDANPADITYWTLPVVQRQLPSGAVVLELGDVAEHILGELGGPPTDGAGVTGPLLLPPSSPPLHGCAD